MNRPALERTNLLFTTLTLAALISGLIPTLAFAQSFQTTNYYGPASAPSPPAMLNGSVIQSTSNGNSSGMRMMRSQAASTPGNTPQASLFSNEAMSSFASPASSSTASYSNSSTQSYQSTANATTYDTTANHASSNFTSTNLSAGVNASAGAADQSQSGAAQFDLSKAVSIGTTLLHGFNQLVNASRPPIGGPYGGNPMTAGLLNRSAASVPGSPSLIASAGQQLFQIGRPLNRNEVNLLANYDVAVIIDKSGSMQTTDCPGGLSRWDFCREQVLNLTNQVGSAFRSGITVALFSSDYRIFNNVGFSAVPQIFASNYPDGGTYLARPLKDILTTYFAQRDSNRAMQMPTRPLLVEVITDGEPSDKGALIKVICDATQRMTSAREVNIQFLQIGNDNEGGKVLNELQTRLVPEDGAQYGIVNVEPFQTVLYEGLAHSMVSAAAGGPH